jgi:hypothetical protein
MSMGRSTSVYSRTFEVRLFNRYFDKRLQAILGFDVLTKTLASGATFIFKTIRFEKLNETVNSRTSVVETKRAYEI